MIFTILNEKGGTGKTTITFNLAVLFQSRAKADIVLIDADKQKSLTSINNLRLEKKFKISELDEADKHKDKIILIDTGGRDSKEMRQSIIISDVLIIVLNISQLDLFALSRIQTLINEALQFNKNRKTFYLLNRVPTNFFLSKEINEFKDVLLQTGINIFNTEIKERSSYKRSIQDGLSVVECKKDIKAEGEIKSLYNEIKIKCNVKEM